MYNICLLIHAYENGPPSENKAINYAIELAVVQERALPTECAAALVHRIGAGMKPTEKFLPQIEKHFESILKTNFPTLNQDANLTLVVMSVSIINER